GPGGCDQRSEARPANTGRDRSACGRAAYRADGDRRWCRARAGLVASGAFRPPRVGRARGASGWLVYSVESRAAWRTPHGPNPTAGGRMIQVLLVDDHAVVRTGFRLLLQSQPDINVAAEAQSGEAACQIYAELNPDVVVMDLGMPGMGGLEALRRIRARNSAARVLALSAHDDP